MRGHIQQRGKDSWRIKVFVGRDAAGVRRYVERTVRGTRREAEREVARVVVEVDEGRHVASARLALDELLDRWLDVKRRTVEASTLQRSAGTVLIRLNQPSLVRPFAGSFGWNWPFFSVDDLVTMVIWPYSSSGTAITTAGRSGSGSSGSRSGGRSQWSRPTSGSYGSSDASNPSGILINSHRRYEPVWPACMRSEWCP
jgi:hypothetical protein